ncbi:zinc finger protein [Trichonephila clavipes]|nr:zinc finger protein [Trichonephila clavipes]
MSGRFLKVTVADDVDYRALSKWLESSGVEFKSFMLKQDRPVKVVIRGLPSNTEPEDIKTEIEAEGFKVLKISQMKNYRTKAPMPLFYLQIENGVDAPKIYDFTELFGTRIEVKPFDRGNKVNQCWRCQGGFTPQRCATSLPAPLSVCRTPRGQRLHLRIRGAHEVRELLGRSCGQLESVP